MHHKLTSQLGIDKCRTELTGTQAGHVQHHGQTAQQTVKNEIGLFRGKNHGKQLVFETKSHNGENRYYHNDTEKYTPQFIQMVPKCHYFVILLHFLLLFLVFVICFVIKSVYTVLETFYSFTQAFHQFGDLFPAEKQQDNQYDEDNFLCSDAKHNRFYWMGFTFLPLGCS